MPQYGHITKSDAPDAYSGGYKNVFMFAPRADFTAIAAPAASAGVLGDTLEIETAHTFPVGKGFFEYECKQHSITLKGATVGDDGAKEIEWTGEFIILGDSASTQEQVSRLLNADTIVLLREADCAAGQYVQLGTECVSPTFNVEFDGKTTKEGKKEYKVTVACKKKYFYNANYTKAGA